EKLEKQLKAMAKERAFKSVELKFDDEHNLWEARYVSSQGAEHVINWELASSPECRQMNSKFKQIEPYMEPPFVVELVGKAAAAGSGNGDEAGDGESAEVAENAEDAKHADEKEAKLEKKAAKTAPKRKTEVELVEKSNARDL